MPSAATLKLIGLGVGALALIFLVAMVLDWRSERNELRAWQDSVLTTTREASANPKLKARDVPQQIRLLGQSVAELKAAIARQNAAVDAIAKESAKAQEDAQKATSAAKERANAAEATADRLRASAARPRAGNAPSCACEPSETLKEAWR